MMRFFLKLKILRYFYVLIRLFIFVYFLKKLRLIKESRKNVESTTDRNLKSLLSLRDSYDGSRSDFFLNKLKMIENLDYIKKSKVLIVGPRNEGEIYNFYTKGFLMKNITAIDLISYSNKIVACDANKYLKNCHKKFDFIYFGFVVNYFKDPKKILSLAKKCLLKNGYLIVCSQAPRKIEVKFLRIFFSLESSNKLNEKDSRKIEKTLKFHNLKSLNDIFPKNLSYFYKSMYVEKLYFFKSQFIKCFIIIKKNNKN